MRRFKTTPLPALYKTSRLAKVGSPGDLEKMKEEYYKLRGWVNGMPTPGKLKELEIEL